MLNLREENIAVQQLRQPRLERAFGVIYRPQTERASHYFQARLSEQFDAVLHFDEVRGSPVKRWSVSPSRSEVGSLQAARRGLSDQTRAIEPLERTSQWETGEAPETFPTGM